MSQGEKGKNMGRKPKEEQAEEGLFEVGVDELDEVLAGLPSDDSVINLFRVNPVGRSAYVAEFTPGEFSLDAVRNTYGGGKYKYVAKSGSLIRRGTFEVDGEPKSGGRPKIGYKRYDERGRLVFVKPDDPEAIAIGARSEQLQKNGNGDVSLVLLLDEIRRLREEVRQPVQSPETIKKSFLEEMMIFKQLFGNEKSPSEDLSKNVIELIKQGIEVGQMAEGGGSPWLMVLDKVLPTVQETLKVLATQQQRDIQRIQKQEVQGQGQENLPAPGPVLSEVPLTGFDSIADKLRAYMPTFLSAASANSDPSILVDLTVPNIPESDKSTVIEWLSSDKWFFDLCKLHPLIQGQRAWWTEYGEGLLMALQGKEPEEQETTE